MPLKKVKVPKQKFIPISKDVFINELSLSFKLEKEQKLFKQLANGLQHLFDADRVEQREVLEFI